MFIEKEFDKIRLEWAKKLKDTRLEWAKKLQEPFRRLNFFGVDRDVILPPFRWISYPYVNQPTDTPMPSGLLRIQSCVELV